MKAIGYVYAALLLKEAGQTVTGEKIATLISAAGVSPDLEITSKLGKKSEMIDNVYEEVHRTNYYGLYPPVIEEEVEEEIIEEEEEITSMADLFK